MKINVYENRINRGLSQQQLADEIGVSVDVIRNLEESGARPRPANAAAVAKHYGLTVMEMWPVERQPA